MSATKLVLIPAIGFPMMLASCTQRSNHLAAPGARIEFLSSPASKSLNLPFSEAVRVGDVLYLSGQVGNLPGARELVQGGIQAETRQVLDNIKAVLERHGSSLDRVVKCTVFLVDINEWSKMNEVYRTYFSTNPPARSTVAGSGLALGARVEIECIAAVDAPSRN